MAILLQFQINIVLTVLLIILLGHAYFNIRRTITTNKFFLWITGLTILILILEIFSVVLSNPNLKQFIVLNKLVNVIGFIVTPIIPFLGFIFIKEWVNRYHKVKLKVNKMLIVPLFINGIGAVSSYNCGLLFHITSENIYDRGPLFFILPCISCVYFVYSLYFIYKHRKRFTDSELVMFSMFYIVPAIFTSIQLRYAVYLTIWTSTAVIIVFFYIFILNDQVYRDSMTGLENRLSFEQYIQKLGHKKLNKLFVFYIDLDEFKTINDQYGHCEGDEAIKTFANLLVESFALRKKKLIRLGGDEFLIILEDQRQELATECIQNLTQHVEEYNNTGEKLYRLRFSYGMACYTNAHESFCNILEHVEQLMYEQKLSKKLKL